jgi:hypothetical protein
MNKVIALIGLLAFLSGCSWFHHGEGSTAEGRGGIPGSDYSPGRGTTGVSSGADAGQGITGSDAAPP